MEIHTLPFYMKMARGLTSSPSLWERTEVRVTIKNGCSTLSEQPFYYLLQTIHTLLQRHHLKLAVVNLGIEAFLLQQFLVLTLLDNVAIPDHQD